MNIFKILSSGDGKIFEPSISSFLAYLLDPKEDHGLSSTLLSSIIMDFKNKDKNFFSRITTPASIKSVDIRTEEKVYLDNDKSRDIDIVVEIFDDFKSSEPRYVLCIENKIKDSAIQESQLREELAGIEKVYADNKVRPEIYFCFITLKDSKNADKEYNNLEYDKKLHLLWKKREKSTNQDEKLLSIQEKLLKILNMDRNGEIDPISADVMFLLKSFILFIKSEFKSKLEEAKQRLNYGKTVIEYFRDVANSLNLGTDYSPREVKAMVRERIKEASGIDINTSTLYCQMCVAVANEQNRVHFGVSRKNAVSKSIFYYPDENDKSIIRKYVPGMQNVEPYYKKGKGTK